MVWRYRAFHNSARTDDLRLNHWTKANKDALVSTSTFNHFAVHLHPGM